MPCTTTKTSQLDGASPIKRGYAFVIYQPVMGFMRGDARATPPRWCVCHLVLVPLYYNMALSSPMSGATPNHRQFTICILLLGLARCHAGYCKEGGAQGQSSEKRFEQVCYKVYTTDFHFFRSIFKKYRLSVWRSSTSSCQAELQLVLHHNLFVTKTIILPLLFILLLIEKTRGSK